MMNNDQWLDPNIERRKPDRAAGSAPGLCDKIIALGVVAAIIAGLWYGAPYVHRFFSRMDEIRPHEYAQLEEWDNEYTHDYIQASLADDGLISRWEYRRTYWLQNKGLAERLKDKK